MILVKRIDGKILKNPVYWGGNPSRSGGWMITVDQDLERIVFAIQIKSCVHPNGIANIRKRISKILRDHNMQAKVSKEYWGERTSFPPDYKGLKSVVCVVIKLTAPFPLGCSNTYESEVFIKAGLSEYTIVPEGV